MEPLMIEGVPAPARRPRGVAVGLVLAGGLLVGFALLSSAGASLPRVAALALRTSPGAQHGWWSCRTVTPCASSVQMQDAPVLKDPNAPKKPKSSYFVYLGEERQNIIQQHGLNPSKVAEVSKKAGELWGALSAAEKAPYDALAAEDKARYEKEMSTYVPDPSQFVETKKGSRSQSKSKSKAPKDPNAPKKNKSAYFIWMNEERKNLIEQYGLNPSKVAEVAKKAGEVWGEMTPEAKVPYEQKAAEDKVRFEREMATYQPAAQPA